MKITRNQLRSIIKEAYGKLPDDVNFSVAMKIKDMIPADEAANMREEDLYDLAVGVYEKHFDFENEGWAPYDEDIEEIRAHLTILPNTDDDDYDEFNER